MPERIDTRFAQVLNRAAALCTRVPSEPVLVDGVPWTGDRLGDVAISMTPNRNVVRQHLRVASACIEAGLDTVFLYADFGEAYTARLEWYVVPGARIVKLPLRWARARLRFPNPLVLLSMLAELESIFHRPPIGALVTHIDHCLFHGLLVYWAKRQGIPSVVVQEGMTVIDRDFGRSDLPLSIQRGIGALPGLLRRQVPHQLFREMPPYTVSDYFCAYGEAARRESLRLGRDSATAFVVGNPSFDHLTSEPQRRPARKKDHTILYAEQHIVEQREELRFFDELARICCDRNGDRLIIKLHPFAPWKAEDIAREISTSEARARLLQVVGTGDVVDMLDDVDVLLTIHSTTAYHAFVKGIPVITVDYLTKNRGRLDAYQYGGALSVQDERGLEGAIHDATANETVRARLHEGAARVIANHLYRLDGQASARIAQVVRELSCGRTE